MSLSFTNISNIQQTSIMVPGPLMELRQDNSDRGHRFSDMLPTDLKALEISNKVSNYILIRLKHALGW